MEEREELENQYNKDYHKKVKELEASKKVKEKELLSEFKKQTSVINNES